VTPGARAIEVDLGTHVVRVDAESGAVRSTPAGGGDARAVGVLEAVPHAREERLGTLLGSADRLPRSDAELRLGRYEHRAFGMGIRSDVRLDNSNLEGGDPDVAVRVAYAGDAAAGAASIAIAPEHATVRDPSVGRFEVANGERVEAVIAPGAHEPVVRLFLVGPCFALLLRQRGYVVLHASAVAVEGSAVCMIGSGYAGKSTTARMLHARGHAAVTDDLLALRIGPGGAEAVPGFQELRLWPDAIDGTEAGELASSLVHPGLDKRSLAPTTVAADSLPVARIYSLEWGERLAVERLALDDALFALLTHSDEYVIHGVVATGQLARYVEECASLARRTPVHRLVRPRATAELGAVAAAILST
jgi:hypothetical protein